MINAYCEPLTFELPPISDPAGESQPWRRWIDTSLASPADIAPWKMAPTVLGGEYAVAPRSVVICVRHMWTGTGALVV